MAPAADAANEAARRRLRREEGGGGSRWCNKAGDRGAVEGAGQVTEATARTAKALRVVDAGAGAAKSAARPQSKALAR